MYFFLSLLPGPHGPWSAQGAPVRSQPRQSRNPLPGAVPGPLRAEGPHWERRIPRERQARRGEAQPALQESSYGKEPGASPAAALPPPAGSYHQVPLVLFSLLCCRQHRALCFSQLLASIASPTGVSLLFVSFVPQVGGYFTRNSLHFN